MSHKVISPRVQFTEFSTAGPTICLALLAFPSVLEGWEEDKADTARGFFKVVSFTHG